MKNNDININVNTTESSKGKQNNTSVAKWIFNLISTTSWKTILKVYFVMFFFLASAVLLVFGYTIAKNGELAKDLIEEVADENKNENIRDFVVTPRIQHDLRILMYTLNADRAFIFELHNGKKNTSGLPFRYADMSYEVVNDEKRVDRVAMSFQNIPLTLYTYPHYLQKEKVIVGTVEEIEEVDADFAKHIKEIGGKYLGMTYINSGGNPLAFLCISYHSMEDIPKKELIRMKLIEYSSSIGHLLDLDTHKK